MDYGYEQDNDWQWADAARQQEAYRESQRAKSAMRLRQAVQAELVDTLRDTTAQQGPPNGHVLQVAAMAVTVEAPSFAKAS